MRAVLVLSLVLLGSCHPVEQTTSPGHAGIRVWRDAETGCEYLILYSSSITPRLGRPCAAS